METAREALLIVLYRVCSITDIRERKIYIIYPAVYAPLAVVFAFACGVKAAEIALSFVPGVILYSVSKLSKGKVGMGDVYLIMAAGPALLLSGTLECVMYALAGAAIFGGTGLLTGKCSKDSKIPFAPFLLGSAVIVCAIQ